MHRLSVKESYLNIQIQLNKVRRKEKEAEEPCSGAVIILGV
jgi:hypothetical protein